MAKFRLDPNIDFWKNLKDGSDHFEVTKNEPSVLVCGKHYVFDATASGAVSGSEPCPALKRDQNVEALVAEKENKDETKVAELVASGVKPIRLVYADGGQNPVFTGYKDVSDPDALASGPQEIVLGDRAKPVSAAVKVAAADAEKKRAASVAPAPVEAAAAQAAPTTIVAASAPASQSAGMLGGLAGGAKDVQKWLHLGGQDARACRRGGGRSRSAGSFIAAATAPRRRASGVAACADPANATEFRRNSGGRARFRALDGAAAAIATP